MEVTVIVSSTGVTIEVPNGTNGIGVPAGGITDQVLTKLSNTSYDTGWAYVSGLPAGGTTGQALLKDSNTDYLASWQTIPLLGNTNVFTGINTFTEATTFDAPGTSFSSLSDLSVYSTSLVLQMGLVAPPDGYVLTSSELDGTAVWAPPFAPEPGPPTGAAGGDLSGDYPNPTIAENAVTYDKMQTTSAPSVLIGRGEPTAGEIQEIALGAGLTMTGTTIDVTGGSAEDLIVICRNNSGVTIPKGSAVKIDSAQGQNPVITLARANAYATSDVVGITNVSISNNSTGAIVVNGLMRNMNTSAFADGDHLYLSASTAGAFQTTLPVKPNIVVQVGTIAHAHPTQGKILVEPIIRSVPVANIYDSTTTGDALIQAASAPAARTTLGSTVTGDALFTTANAGAARTTLGSTATGDALFIAANAGAARTTLGATVTGSSLFTTTNAGAARTTLGATATGDALFIATDAPAARTTLGATTTGNSLFTAASAPAARTTLGSTTVGDAVFVAATASAGRTALGSTTTGDALFTTASAGAARTTLGSTTTGDALFTTASAAAARTTLGSTTVGDAVFIAADAAAARTAIGLTQSVDVQTFTSSDVWVKPAGALMVSITMSGGGAGGGFGDATTGGLGGGAGEGLTQTFLAAEFDVEAYVGIGAGGNGGIGAGVGGTPAAVRAQKGSSSFVEFYDEFNAYYKAWAFGGGYGGGASIVNSGTSRTNQPIFATTQWGRGGITGAGARGGYFSGGGGLGSINLGVGGTPGGDTNSFSVLDSGAIRAVATGGGAAQGATGATGGNGSDGEVHSSGFGTGAGGGGAPPNGSTTAMGGNGGNGIRGSGGGGGGRGGSTSAGSNGGNGGDGFVIITTVCYT